MVDRLTFDLLYKILLSQEQNMNFFVCLNVFQESMIYHLDSDLGLSNQGLDSLLTFSTHCRCW